MPKNLLNILGPLSLDKDVNKVEETAQKEGILSVQRDILTLDTSDDDLLSLKKTWIDKWEAHNIKLDRRRKDGENYWLGKQAGDFLDNVGDDFDHPLVDNLVFEALETYLPQATRRNPEPVVSSDGTPEGEKLADDVRKMLIYLSDVLRLKLKLKTITRNWALYFSGVAKIVWDIEADEIDVLPIRPQKLILDPNAAIDEGGKYLGKYLGEYKTDIAEDLVDKFPDKKDAIKRIANNKMGTEIQYIEWWAESGRIIFWTLKDIVLDKSLNPHFNYEGTKKVVDEYGIEKDEPFTKANHYNKPQIPYFFLSVFNLGLHPHDDTSLIEQNLGNQDKITKRYRQIDTNVDGINGGWAISGELSGISKEQSGAVIRSFREGGGVWIPNGDVNSAVAPMKQTSLPSDVFNDLQDARNEFRGIFGVAGSTPQGTEQENTVRGKIIRSQQDQSRIGGGISEYIEQFADSVFNYMVQMMYVYYDTPHIASIIGSENAIETVTIKNEDLNRKLVISVKEGSMIPKDPLTVANQAIDLFSAGAIDLITLHERLDDPNPRETALKTIQMAQNPSSVFPEIAGQVPQTQDLESAKSTELLDSVPI